MKANLAETAGISALRVIREHETIAFNTEEATRDRQKSLDAINLMLGYNAAVKQEISGTGININFVNHAND